MSFCADCLCWQDGEDDVERYKTYRRVVPRRSLLLQDGGQRPALPHRHRHGVAWRRWGTSYSLDAAAHPVTAECGSDSVDRWNLNFFDGRTDGAYSVLQMEMMSCDPPRFVPLEFNLR